jgi:hypothetical protein
MPKDIDQDVVENDVSDGDLQAGNDLGELSEDEELLDEDEDVLDEEDDDALVDDALEDDALEDDALVVPAAEGAVAAPVRPAAEGEEAAAEEEDEEEIDDDDVEASLDVILKERLVVEDEEPEDEDEPADAEDRSDGNLRVLPKQPGEFVCRSCFLVKSETQLADPKRVLCRDCV